VTKRIYIEGRGSKDGAIRCREGFRKLLERAGFAQRMPRLIACRGRKSAFEQFKSDHAGASKSDFVALLIDSETVKNLSLTLQKPGNMQANETAGKSPRRPRTAKCYS